MKKGSISLDEYIETIERYDKMLREANELLRSAYAIAQRDGVETNWEAFRAQLKKALQVQHESGLTQRAVDAAYACEDCGSVDPQVHYPNCPVAKSRRN